jgi:hypothetical protein
VRGVAPSGRRRARSAPFAEVTTIQSTAPRRRHEGQRRRREDR